MNFINKLFKKKEPSWRKEKYIPEYHKCPMCGEMVKTHVKLYSDNPLRYLDGEPKITTKEIVDSLQFCEHCGYIYEGYDYAFYKTATPSIPIDYKKRFQSDSYQNALKNNDMDPYYKKLLLYDLILETEKSETQCSLYYEYKYQFEKGNIKEEQQLLELKLQEVIDGKAHGRMVGNHKLYYDNRWSVGIHKEEMMVDMLRRLNRFDEAKKLVTECMKDYKNKGQEEWPNYEYYTYQLGLIETRDSRHI